MKTIFLSLLLFNQILFVYGKPANVSPPSIYGSDPLKFLSETTSVRLSTPDSTRKDSSGKLTATKNEKLQKTCGHYAGVQLKSFGSIRSTRSEAPWVVGMALAVEKVGGIGIGNFTSTKSLCSATLISNRHVLTAYHCLAGLLDTKMYVRRDWINADQKDNIDEFRFYSTMIVVQRRQESISPKNFPNQMRDGHMDIAVFELDEPVNFSNDLYPACLSETRPSDEDLLDLYAFGKDERNKQETLTGSLQHIRLTNLPCYKKEGIDTFCSRSDKQHPLPGDSGGGYVYKYNNITYVTGVVSGGVNITEIVSERRDIAVAHHLHWICTHTGICVDESKTEQIHTFIDTITPYV